MRYLIFIKIAALLFFISGSCFAKERFTHLTINDGLSQSSVKCLFQDSKGFIWAGTADGLNRYDGYDFTTYRIDPQNPKSIGSNDITCIYENPGDSNLYIGTQDAGLFIYNRNTNDFISVEAKLQQGQIVLSKFIKDMLSTTDGTFWIATQFGGLLSYNPADSTFQRPDFSTQDRFRNINCLIEDNVGNLWLGTQYGLYKWSSEFREEGKPPVLVNFNNSTSQPNISALTFDVKGNLWIGTRGRGLFVYHPNSQKLKSYRNNGAINSVASNLIYDIVETTSGNIWIATNDGLCRYDSEKDNFIVFRNRENDSESINNNDIYCLLNDNSGILWIGTFTGGINKLDPNQYRFPKYETFHPKKSNRIQAKDVRSVHVNENGVLWLGTAIGLLEIHGTGLSTNTPTIDVVKKHLSGQYMGALTSNSEGLIAKARGNIVLVKRDGKIIDFSKRIEQKTGIYISHFNGSVTDDYDNIWLATPSGLLKYNEQQNTFKLFNPIGPDSESLPLNPGSIFSDYSGKIWIGTYNALLYTFDIHTEKFERIFTGDTEDRQTSFNKIFSICETQPNNLWFGTDRGLYFLDVKTGKTKRFLASDGLANNTVYAVVADNNEKVWCSTNMGISCFDTKTNSFHNYTYEDGLQNNEFNEGTYFKDKDGIIYMGGIEGLNVFDPDKIKLNTFVPPVVITEMEIQYKKVTPISHPKVTSKQISETNYLRLNYKQNAFSFKFTALSYSLSKKNKYKFSLTEIGKQDNWIEAGHERDASYTNISPGNYIFKVKGSNSDGVWNEKPTSITIIIPPPYWQTWWFRLLVILTLLGLTFLTFYLRVRNIKQQKKILQKQVNEKTKALVVQKERIESQNKRLQQKADDISQKNKLLNEQHIRILDQRDKLLELNEKVEEANRTKIHFFTGISHELRTPLTLITSPLKNLIENIETTNTKELKRKLTNIYVNSSKLLLIVNQLLDFRKAETNNTEMHISEIDMVSFVYKTSLLFNELAKQKKFQFNFTSAADQLTVYVDTDKLEKIIYNILSNAFKFTPQGGEINVHVSCSEEENKFAVLSIKDNGVGIEENKLPFIFEQFYQLKQTQKLPNAGSGLGLALVAKYIELHKGDIKVKSTQGVGSEFIIKIPVGKDHFDGDVVFDNQEHNQRELLQATIGDYIPVSNNDLTESGNKNKSTLLVIEDDHDLRAYIKEFLSAQYKVEEAENAEQGFQLATTKNPDAIICDVMLPDMNGFKLCSKLKSEFQTSHLPIILLTSLADKESRLSGIKSGADYFISKPFDLKHLVLSIENLIEGRLRLQKKYSLTDPDNINQVVSNTKDQSFLKEAIKIIDKNIIDSTFNVESFCEQMDLSQPQCYRKIKAITGLNISEFIRNTRLKKASKMLKTGEYKINEVAYETGFNDPNYFTKCFTKLFGVTPSDYIKS
uniref:hybrid sensor histidine kinase/response regulator transcription factor n=1 Tax=uncultured Draconibacterium sp. TaxID=1573823 RepID=UPI0032175369